MKTALELVNDKLREIACIDKTIESTRVEIKNLGKEIANNSFNCETKNLEKLMEEYNFLKHRIRVLIKRYNKFYHSLRFLLDIGFVDGSLFRNLCEIYNFHAFEYSDEKTEKKHESYRFFWSIRYYIFRTKLDKILF